MPRHRQTVWWSPKPRPKDGRTSRGTEYNHPPRQAAAAAAAYARTYAPSESCLAVFRRNLPPPKLVAASSQPPPAPPDWPAFGRAGARPECSRDTFCGGQAFGRTGNSINNGNTKKYRRRTYTSTQGTEQRKRGGRWSGRFSRDQHVGSYRYRYRGVHYSSGMKNIKNIEVVRGAGGSRRVLPAGFETQGRAFTVDRKAKGNRHKSGVRCNRRKGRQPSAQRQG